YIFILTARSGAWRLIATGSCQPLSHSPPRSNRGSRSVVTGVQPRTCKPATEPHKGGSVEPPVCFPVATVECDTAFDRDCGYESLALNQFRIARTGTDKDVAVPALRSPQY